MGFTPQQVNAMSMWEWAACAEGYVAAHETDEDRRAAPMSDDEFAAAEAMLES
jgi:hypothetical protein